MPLHYLRLLAFLPHAQMGGTLFLLQQRKPCARLYRCRVVDRGIV